MKKYLLFSLIISCLMGVNITAQTFTFSRIDPNPVYGSASDQLKSHGVVHNLTNQTLMLTININNRFVTSGWDSIGMCTWNLCYGAGQYVINEGISANATDTIYVYFSPNGIAGNGSCTVNITYQSTSVNQDFGVVAWPISIKQISTTVKDFALSQNYPNPFNPSTKINFSVPSANYVDLRVYDILGREVKVLASKFVNAGEYEVEFDAKDLASGMYYYRLQSGENVAVKKMTLVK